MGFIPTKSKLPPTPPPEFEDDFENVYANKKGNRMQNPEFISLFLYAWGSVCFLIGTLIKIYYLEVIQ